ncbi:MAG: GAF domain-containing protein [Anaerolineales bacterium]|jgi:PAS domain S-box-containing protein
MSNKSDEFQNTRATLETLYNISRELATALDLRTVLQRVLFLAMKHVGAMSGSIIVLDDTGQPVESAIIHGAELHDETTHQLRVTVERGLAGWVINNRQAAVVTDTSRDDRWVRRPDDAENRTGPKSAVSAPLLAREQIVGVITLVHPQTGFFTMEHLELVQTIADQAGIAVLNARLYADSQRQARVMTALAETAAVINATLSLEEVFSRIMVQIEQALRVQAASLALIDYASNEIVFKAATGWVGDQVVGIRLDIGQGVAGWVAREGRGVIVPTVEQDNRFDPETDERTGYTTRAIACAPIRLRGEVIGVLEAINPTNGMFDADALLVLTGIGNLAGTAIRHAQLFESLEAAHQRYRELFEDSIDPILITNLEGRIEEANRRAEDAFGYSAAELQNISIADVHELDVEHLGTQLEKLLETRKTMTYESLLHTQSGDDIPVQVYARLVEIDGVSHLQWIIRDITERKNLDRLREDLIAMVYHDLRSPLANVISSLDVLKSMLPDVGDVSTHSILKIAQRSTERIQRLTNSLLDVNRLSSGQAILAQGPTNIHELVNDAVDSVDLVLASKKHTLELDLPEQLPPVYVDGDMIRRVLINLVENAIKYTPSQGKIVIGAEQEGDWLQVWVIDNGRGIPQSEQKNIFDKFSRASGMEIESKGLGLGLTFCRMAIEGHGGNIWVESQEGQGSKFSFSLPLTVERDRQMNNLAH